LKALKLDSVEKVYSKIHDEIKKNPDFAKKEHKKVKTEWQDKRKTICVTAKKDKNGKPVVYKRDRRLTKDERNEKIAKKIQKALKGK